MAKTAQRLAVCSTTDDSIVQQLLQQMAGSCLRIIEKLEVYIDRSAVPVGTFSNCNYKIIKLLICCREVPSHATQ